LKRKQRDDGSDIFAEHRIRRFSTSSHPEALGACYVASWQLPRPDLHRSADDDFSGHTMRGLGGWGRRNPARDAFGKLVVAQLAAERLQAILRTMPLEVKDPLLERHIPAQSRQAAIKKNIFLMSPETFGKPERPGKSQAPSAMVVGN
jgi:hypothetical protein